MADKLSEQQIAEYKEAFNLFDKNGDGMISADEIGNIFRSVGKNPTEAEIRAIVLDIDKDGSGVIDFAEFLELMAGRIKGGDSEEDFKAAFKVFDSDDNGWISATDLMHIMTNMGEKITLDEAEKLIEALDSTGEGMIMYEDFAKLLMKS